MKKIVIIVNILFFTLIGLKIWFIQPSVCLQNYISKEVEKDSLIFSQYKDCDLVFLSNSYEAKQAIKELKVKKASRLVISDYNEYIYVFLIKNNTVVEFTKVEERESYEFLRKYMDQQYAGNYIFE